MSAKQSTAQLVVISTLAELAQIKASVDGQTGAVGSVPRGLQVLHAPSGARFTVVNFPSATGPKLVPDTNDFTDYVTGSDLSASVGKFVKLNNATRKVELCSSEGELPQGVLTYVESAAADSACVIRAFGPCYVINTGGVTKGDGMVTTAAGLAKTNDSATAVAGANVNGAFIVASALETKATGLATYCFVGHWGLQPTTYI